MVNGQNYLDPQASVFLIDSDNCFTDFGFN
jgi:hypothetical protein